MVLYFHPRGFSPPEDYLIYMGKDKFENEELIRYGLPLDIWFHVDSLSSAHVYLRLPRGATMDDIPPDTLQDCAQLVKANSIQGCKMNNVDIVYTAWANLKKTSSMEVGQVGFHKQKEVRKCTVEKKDNDILNRLNKTKRETTPDLAAERQAYDKEVSAERKAQVQAVKRAEKAAKEETKREQELRSYKGLMTDDNMISGKELADKYESAQDYEDDFM